jgi:glutamate 5-kinase
MGGLMGNPRERLRHARRIVVKVGTRAILTDDRKPDRPGIERLMADAIALQERGVQVVVVSSGAIGTGLGPLGFKRRPAAIPDLQAAAAVGQALLMEAYNAVLAPRGYAAAQLLLTHEDFQDRERYLNTRNTLNALHGRRVVPVINENDTVAVDEIKFGDNDALSALVANLIGADLLIVFSDVDGLHDAPPGAGRRTRRIDVVEKVTPEIEALAGATGSVLGTGGMVSKLRAAKAATAAGAAMVLAHGKADSVAAIVRGEPVGTLFLPAQKPLDHRKRWIAHSLREAGTLTVDAGGAKAIRDHGKSLLPAGIRDCGGDFRAGDAVAISGPDGKAVAKGIVDYSADEVRRIRGRKTSEIEKILGYKVTDEVVHRDNMVVFS